MCVFAFDILIFTHYDEHYTARGWASTVVTRNHTHSSFSYRIRLPLPPSEPPDTLCVHRQCFNFTFPSFHNSTY